jgi:hypothetical protein
MKVIGIVGSRRRDTDEDHKKVEEAFWSIYEDGDTIVSGGCPRGGDKFAMMIHETYDDIPIKVHYPEWGLLGKMAGLARNGLIAREADILIACVAEDRTGGTEDTIRKFKFFHPEGAKLILV